MGSAPSKLREIPRDAWTHRLRRRLLTIPGIFLGALLWLLTAPLIGLLAFVVDLFRPVGGTELRPTRWATLRMWLFAGAYLGGEALGLMWLLGDWIRSGFGSRPERLRELAHATQRRWLRMHWNTTRRIYGLDVRVERPDRLPRGPFVVLMRHTSLIDPLISGVFLGADYKLRLRYVLKRGLLLDPCLDVGGHWMPNHFIDRSGQNRRRELRALRALASDMEDDEGVLIYPEGTRFSETRRKQALERLAKEDRLLHGLALRCHHTLPPRAAGTLALLNAAPKADVIVVYHAGFLGLSSFRDLWDGALTGRTIHVRLHHHKRDALPLEPEARVRWLFDVWARIDAWVATRESRSEHTHPRASRPRTTGPHPSV